MEDKPGLSWRYIAPAILWPGAMVAFPLLRFVPDSYGLPAFLGAWSATPLAAAGCSTACGEGAIA